MFRLKIPSLTFHRNTPSKNRLTILINPRPVFNLKRESLNSISNDICDKNDKIVTNEMAKTIFPIVSNNSSLNFHKKMSNSRNYTFTKSNTLHQASTFLIRNSPIISLNVRHLSTESTQHITIPQLTGIWKDMSESVPVEFVQNTLISFQSSTGLPWWATIILTTFVVRGTMTLPLSIYQHYIFAKVQNLQGLMNEEVNKLKLQANIAVAHHNWTEQYARMVYEKSVKMKWNELIQRENCHPAKGLIVLWTQIPLWITISAALRNLCYMLPPGHTNAEKVFLELTTGGFGWVTNLIAVDHYWIIPGSIGIFNLANIEIMTLMKLKEDTRLQKYLLYFFRFVSIAMVPIATYVPSCICLYWASSSAFGLLQNLLLFSPKMRRFGGIPLTSTERTNPYRDLLTNFQAKTYFNFSLKGKSLK